MSQQPGLPLGWEQVPSGEGDFYYWNKATNEVTWERPVGPPPPPPRSGRSPVPSTAAPIPPSSTASSPPPTGSTSPAGASAGGSRGGRAGSSTASGTSGGSEPRPMAQASSPPPPGSSDTTAFTRVSGPRASIPAPLPPRKTPPTSLPPPTDAMSEKLRAASLSSPPPDAASPPTPSKPTKPGRPSVTSPPISPAPSTSTSPATVEGGGGKRASPSPKADAQRFIKRSYVGTERQVAAAALGLVFANEQTFTGRELLREGPLRKISRDGPEQVQVFLLADSLIYAELSMSTHKYTLRREIRLETCAVGECCPPAPNRFLVQSSQKSFILQADDNIEKVSWMGDISAQIRAHMSAKGLKEGPCAFAPVWDANKDAPQCTHCNAKFGLLNSRHHCRNCGHIFCQACCYEKFRLPHIDDKRLVRVCLACYRELSETRRYGVGQGATPST